MNEPSTDSDIRKRLKTWIAAYADEQAPAAREELESARELLFENAEPDNIRRVHESLETLQRLSPDASTVVAAVLFPLARSDNRVILDKHRSRFNERTAELLDQLTRLSHFGQTYLPDDHARAEGLRRLLLALAADFRTVLIALSWQLARLRLARDENETVRREIARETRMIHAPLANRLGIWQLKWELEDLSFRFLEPDTYHTISRLVAERRAERQAFIDQFMDELRSAVEAAGVSAEISGRAKHIYSIWNKMQRKGLDFHELFDVRAVRVLVDSVAECYSVLGLVHAHWQPVPGEFDDYITNPKANFYQSLHTAVSGPGGRVVEVQIRTRDMHHHAEFGVAAHWRYKEGGGPRDSALEKRIGFMRKLMEGIEQEDDDQELLESFQNLTSEDRVYVLTPKGEVRDLVAGATPLDFAYLVHTDIGHRCRGARVNGRIVPLTTELRNGDRVEVLTAREPRPSRDWINPGLGYIRTARARAKVRHWFKLANFDDNLAAGRQAVEAEFKRLDLDLKDLPSILETFNFKRVDDLLVAVGCGELTSGQIAGAVERLHAETRVPDTLPIRQPATGPTDGDDVQVEGVGNLLYQMARCCQPVPGDPIGGYVTRTRGISIHREDCRQFLQLVRQHPERIMEVRWSGQQRGRYPARLLVEAWDRRELIRDIGTLLASENINVTDMTAHHADDGQGVRIELTVQVDDFDQLSGLLARMQAISSVTHARRLRNQ